MTHKEDNEVEMKLISPGGAAESSKPEGEATEERQGWKSQFDFIMSCLSYAVGLGNIWRFPYLCYSNGGGAFLIPYLVMIVFAGIPLVVLETGFGQFAGTGLLNVWDAAPLFRGIGLSMFFVSVFIGVYYNMVVAWSLYYFVVSLRLQLPWQTCDNEWNSPACVSSNGGNLTTPSLGNTSNDSARVSAADEYFHRHVLNISGSVEELGGLQWPLCLSLLGAWALAAVCLVKGIRSSGKAAYVTTFLPYLILVALLIRTLMLDGATDGILFYVRPDWQHLLKPKVWADAAVQIFFSMSVCWGGLITLASYNRFNNNFVRDSVFISAANEATSVFAGFVIFGGLGFLSHKLNTPINNVAKEGPSLAFVVYPELITMLPGPPVWSALFFVMLVTLGLGSQFAVVNTVHTTIADLWPGTFRGAALRVRLCRRSVHIQRTTLLMLAICSLFFAGGLLFCTRAGMFWLHLFDTFAGSYGLLLIALTENIVLVFVYGVDRLYYDMSLMLGRRPSIWWKLCWCLITPLILLFISVSLVLNYKPTVYGGHPLPGWIDAIGFIISLTSFCCIPAMAVYTLCRYRAKHPTFTVAKCALQLTAPTELWKPADAQCKTVYHFDQPKIAFPCSKTQPHAVP